MKILTLLFRRETAIPAVALTFASSVSVALVVARVAWTGRLHYAFLIWNLFLAWLPLIFALLAHERFRQFSKRGRISPAAQREPWTVLPRGDRTAAVAQAQPQRVRLKQREVDSFQHGVSLWTRCGWACATAAVRLFHELLTSFLSALSKLSSPCRRAFSGRDWHFLGLAAAWLLFFPNAPYIFTDLTHLTTRYYAHFWVDLMLVLSCAVTGLVLGFLSLYLMHCMAVKMFGWFLSWVFIAVIAGLSSFGIYLGRFLRFNSWDVIFKPIALYHGIGSWVADPLQNSRTAVFPVLFATFLFISYVMLYALTHLKPATANEGASSALAAV